MLRRGVEDWNTRGCEGQRIRKGEKEKIRRRGDVKKGGGEEGIRE